MSLVALSQDFGEYYDALVSKPRDVEDMLKDLRREEVAARKRLTEEEGCDFRDMLHIAGVWISRKKARESGAGGALRMDRFEMALAERQNEVWFPTAPPKALAPVTRRLCTAFPKKAFREMCEEESELRRWHHGVEAKLRENIERACQQSFFLLTCFDALHVQEERGRARLQRDEADDFAGLRKTMFLAAPPDFYRRLVIERHGETARADDAAVRGLSLEEAEALRRAELVAAEAVARAAVHQPLMEAYDALLFMAHHQEICQRAAIEEDERAALSDAVRQLSRDTFGLLFYQTPALALHAAPCVTPALRQLCSATLTHQQERHAQAVQEHAEVRKAQQEGGGVAWEVANPEAAAQMYARANAIAAGARRSSPSSAFSAPRADDGDGIAADEGLAGAPASPDNVREGPASVASLPFAPDAVFRSSMKKNGSGGDEQSDSSGGSVKAPLCVRFTDAVDDAAADATDLKEAAREAPLAHTGTAAPVPTTTTSRAGKPKKPRRVKKGSFHAFQSDSDAENSAEEGC